MEKVITVMTESHLDIIIDWLLGYGCLIAGRLTERGFLNFAVWIYYSFILLFFFVLLFFDLLFFFVLLMAGTIRHFFTFFSLSSLYIEVLNLVALSSSVHMNNKTLLVLLAFSGLNICLTPPLILCVFLRPCEVYGSLFFSCLNRNSFSLIQPEFLKTILELSPSGLRLLALLNGGMYDPMVKEFYSKTFPPVCLWIGYCSHKSGKEPNYVNKLKI